ncbi:MAG: hypothetical protein JEZ09_06725 [Salinivirgaceae bacterium]|nr:hypothetical protein [Salinivirgaceae bacterium]
MTGQEIVSIQDAIQNAGLNSTKYPKKIEIKIPRARFPGMYLSIPTDGKSFKLQVYCHQASFSFLGKLNTRGYKVDTVDLDKTFSIKEVKGVPSEEEIGDFLNQAMKDVVNIGIVRAPEPEPEVE